MCAAKVFKGGKSKIDTCLKGKCGSRGGLMVSALGSGSGGPGSSLGQGAALCS